MPIISKRLFKSKAESLEFIELFYKSSLPKYIFGVNNFAVEIINNFDIDGLVVDEATKIKEFHGKKIFPLSSIPANSLVVSAVCYGRPITALKKLSRKNIYYLDYFNFRKYSREKLCDVCFLDNFSNEYSVNKSRYSKIFRLLQDVRSKSIFQSIINFRVTQDLKYMSGFKDIQYKQYFESFLKLGKSNESFFDIGCYDGYTSIYFSKKCPGYNSINIFEPDGKNMKAIKKNLAHLKNVSYHAFGLAQKKMTLSFNSNGSSSKISNTGKNKILVQTLDSINPDDLSFIKFDIEGAEESALVGAKKTIVKFKPRIAVSVYHKIDDFWKIPELILSFNPTYKIYLRHYTEGVTETVMFFIP